MTCPCKNGPFSGRTFVHFRGELRLTYRYERHFNHVVAQLLVKFFWVWNTWISIAELASTSPNQSLELMAPYGHVTLDMPA